MKTSLIKSAFVGLIATGAVFAQTDFDPMAAPTAAPAVPAPRPVYSAPAAKAAPVAETEVVKADFDQLRGNAYLGSSMGNAASAFVVADYMAIPHLFYNQNLFYIQPTPGATTGSGVAAYKMGNASLFLGLSNIGGNGMATVGYALQNLGVSLEIGLNSNSTTTKTEAQGAGPLAIPSTETTESEANAGEHFGLNFSYDLGGNVIHSQMSYTTAGTEVDREQGDESSDQANYVADITISYANFPSAQDWFITGFFFAERYNVSEEQKSGSTSQTLTNSDSYALFKVGAYTGKKILSDDISRVFIGMDYALGYAMYDEVAVSAANTGPEDKAKSDIILDLSPNLLAEFAITNSWYVLGGLGHNTNITLASREISAWNGTSAAKTAEVSTRTLISNQTTAGTGVRYMYKNLSLEASLNSAIYSQGPSIVFNSGAILANFGAMLTF